MAAISSASFPGLLEYPEFAPERAAFLLFVERHFQREAGGLGHAADASLLTQRAGAIPVGHIGEETAGVAAGFDLSHGPLDGGAGAAPSIQVGDDGGRHAAGVFVYEPRPTSRPSDLDAEPEVAIIRQDTDGSQVQESELRDVLGSDDPVLAGLSADSNLGHGAEVDPRHHRQPREAPPRSQGRQG